MISFKIIKYFCLTVLAIEASDVAHIRWNSVYVDQKYFSETDLFYKVTTIKLAHQSKCLCSSVCMTRGQCNLFCLDGLLCKLSRWLKTMKILCLIVLAIEASDVANSRWNSVYVDQKYFQEADLNYTVTTIKLAHLSKSSCASVCMTSGKCNLFCLVGLMCKLSRWLVSPRYVPATSTPTIRCYTALEDDYIYNNTFVLDGASQIHPLSNLVDGIYVGNSKYCYQGVIQPMGTIRIELGRLVNIKEITFATSYENDQYNPGGLSIAIFNKSTPLQPGVLYGKFPDNTSLDRTYSFKNSSIIGDTVGLGVWVPTVWFTVALCHMQVF